MSKWGECGLKPMGDLASWEAYKSLSLSSLKRTIDIPLNGILFIPDCKSEFIEEVVSVEEKDGTLFTSTKESTIKNDIWDGESLLDESLFVDEYAEKHMRNNRYDYVFTDLWHDVSDGVDLYVKMKKYEGVCQKATFDYWIEDSILSSIRWSIFDGIYTQVKENPNKWTIEEVETYLSDKYLREFVKFI